MPLLAGPSTYRLDPFTFSPPTYNGYLSLFPSSPSSLKLGPCQSLPLQCSSLHSPIEQLSSTFLRRSFSAVRLFIHQFFRLPSPCNLWPRRSPSPGHCAASVRLLASILSLASTAFYITSPTTFRFARPPGVHCPTVLLTTVSVASPRIAYQHLPSIYLCFWIRTTLK